MHKVNWSGVSHTSLLMLGLVRGDFHFVLHVLWHFGKNFLPCNLFQSVTQKKNETKFKWMTKRKMKENEKDTYSLHNLPTHSPVLCILMTGPSFFRVWKPVLLGDLLGDAWHKSNSRSTQSFLQRKHYSMDSDKVGIQPRRS